MLRYTIKLEPNAELPLPDDRTLAEAGARGMMNLIYSHLLRRNASARRRAGMPKSDYWADAADSMKLEAAGKVGVVTIDKEGAALHYYGGIVYPTGGRKSLAIPVHPAVWDQRPAEFDPSREKLSLVWPKGSSTGTLREKETSRRRNGGNPVTAAEKILQKALVGSNIDSREWNSVQAGLRDRAFFSSQVTEIQLLDAFRLQSARHAAGAADISKLRIELRDYMTRAGMRPGDGTIKDLFSKARLDVRPIFTQLVRLSQTLCGKDG